MHAQMVRLKNGWYIPDLPGFDEIRDNAVIVSVELDREESMKRDYKELRGIAILERYQEKTAREDAMGPQLSPEDVRQVADVLVAAG